MPSLINPLQRSFVPGRSIEENVILIKELAHIFHKAKRAKNIMALKINLMKAFDILEWGFIHDTLVGFAFPPILIKLIMSCISSSSISGLWNRKIADSFQPTRGIRQGDPLSLYIFVLCLERWSQIIDSSIANNEWKPVALSRDLSISHLFYADEVFLFSQALSSNLHCMLNILHQFGTLSSLFLNQAKSHIIFPRRISHPVRMGIIRNSPFNFCSSFGKYVGIPITPTHLRKGDFLVLLDKTIIQIKG